MGFFDGNLGSSSSQFTIGELMNVDQSRQQKANNCEVELLDVVHGVQKENVLERLKSAFLGKTTVNAHYLILKFKVTSDSGSVHKVFIKINPDFNLRNYTNNRVKIYCDCDDFKYRSAYTLGRRNSIFLSSLLKTKLGPALTTPPKKQYTTLLCKHAYAALGWLLQNYQSVMKSN